MKQSRSPIQSGFGAPAPGPAITERDRHGDCVRLPPRDSGSTSQASSGYLFSKFLEEFPGPSEIQAVFIHLPNEQRDANLDRPTRSGIISVGIIPNMKLPTALIPLLTGLLFIGCQSENHRVGIKIDADKPTRLDGFVPFPTNALSCSIKILRTWGEVEVSIKNTSSVKQTFSAPKILTGVDLESEPIAQGNTINFELRWGDNQFACADYSTFERINVAYKTMSLSPDETSRIVINLKDAQLNMRDNLVPFDQCFKKGGSIIFVRVLLVNIRDAKTSVIAQSNEEQFKGKCVY